MDPAVIKDIDDLKTGRLGFSWYYAIKNSQTFGPIDFIDETRPNAVSEFPELQTPVLPDDGMNYFEGIAIPYTAREVIINEEQVFGSGNQLDDDGYQFRRQENPSYINDIPHRVFASRFWRHRRFSSASRELVLKIRQRVSDYTRFVLVDNNSIVGTPLGDAWESSIVPVVNIGDFQGSDKYVHFAVPIANAPDMVHLSSPATPNIFSLFRISGGETYNGVAYRYYSSNNRLDAATYSNEQLLILPERPNLLYHVDPLVLPDAAVGGTYYAGFFSWPKTTVPMPENPVTPAFIAAGVGVVSSTTQQVVMPTDSDGGRYDPDSDNHYARFVAQPVTMDGIDGIYNVSGIPLYNALSEIEALAQTSWDSYWTVQPNTIMLSGIEHNVYLNRVSVNQWSSGGRSGERFLIFRS